MNKEEFLYVVALLNNFKEEHSVFNLASVLEYYNVHEEEIKSAVENIMKLRKHLVEERIIEHENCIEELVALLEEE